MKSFKIRDLMIDVQSQPINLAENHDFVDAVCSPQCTKTCGIPKPGLPPLSIITTKPNPKPKPKQQIENVSELSRLKKSIARMQEEMHEYA